MLASIVSVSTIKSPQCKMVNREEGRRRLMPGRIALTVMAKSATNEPNRLIAASIGLARPVDDTQYGYLWFLQSLANAIDINIVISDMWMWPLQQHWGDAQRY